MSEIRKTMIAGSLFSLNLIVFSAILSPWPVTLLAALVTAWWALRFLSVTLAAELAELRAELGRRGIDVEDIA